MKSHYTNTNNRIDFPKTENKMNERIKELAEQSGFKLIDIRDQFEYNEDSPIKKFAQLIVRECIVDFYRNYLDTTSDEDITEQVDKYVKEHFGVEE